MPLIKGQCPWCSGYGATPMNTWAFWSVVFGSRTQQAGFQRIQFLGRPPSPLATIRMKTENKDKMDEATLLTASPTQRRHELELLVYDRNRHAQGKWMTMMMAHSLPARSTATSAASLDRTKHDRPRTGPTLLELPLQNSKFNRGGNIIAQ